MKRCAFLTLEDPTGYVIDDDLAYQPLQDLGWRVDAVPWSRPGVSWSSYDAVVIRSTWDYAEVPQKFLATLAEIEQSGAPLFNDLPQAVLAGIIIVAVLSLVNGFGSSATAAYGAVNQILNYVQFPALSISIAASILGAQAIGRGRADQLGPITRTGIQLNLVITGTMVAVAYLFSRPVIGWFITDEPVREMAQNLLHIILWSTLIFGCATLVAAVMRASTPGT